MTSKAFTVVVVAAGLAIATSVPPAHGDNAAAAPAVGQPAAAATQGGAEAPSRPDEAAEEPAADTPPDGAVEDEDPRAPVVFNVRFQHVELGGGNSADLVVLRRDAVIPRPKSWRPGVQLATLRFDLPVGHARLGGEEATGLGDLYFQALNVRTPSRTFALASGLGFQLPTATDDFLGSGKWQVAPTLFPIWTLPRMGGLFFIRAQNFVAVAGDDDRRDVNYLTVTPTLIKKLSPRTALLFDTEGVADWERDGELRWKSGILFASRLRKNRATWVKLEVPWGEHRLGEWTLRASIAWRKRAPDPP